MMKKFQKIIKNIIYVVKNNKGVYDMKFIELKNVNKEYSVYIYKNSNYGGYVGKVIIDNGNPVNLYYNNINYNANINNLVTITSYYNNEDNKEDIEKVTIEDVVKVAENIEINTIIIQLITFLLFKAFFQGLQLRDC